MRERFLVEFLERGLPFLRKQELGGSYEVNSHDRRLVRHCGAPGG
jgi:hypothetical protein